MGVKAVTSSAIKAVTDLPAGLRRFAQLERVLALLLVSTPLVLIADDGGVRDSISAYHDVGDPAAFYVPLTIGSMLFLVNGIVRDKHVYNTLLGLALMGVILFDRDGKTGVPHAIFAGAFFGGNFLVMMFLSTHKSKPLKMLLGAGIAAAILLWVFTTLFWAEWVSLAVVALHYALDSAGWSPYRALEPEETPRLVP